MFSRTSFFDLLPVPLSANSIRSRKRNAVPHPVRNGLGKRRNVSLSEETNVEQIRNHSIIVVTDNQNLDQSAREIGLTMSYRKLGQLSVRVTAAASRHAIFALKPGDRHRWDYLQERGWTPHSTFVRTVETRRGAQRKGNVDLLMAFQIGSLVSRSSADFVIIGSGDGDLVEETALGIRSLPTPRKILTLSFRHSTARRLFAENSDLIDGNIFIGLDCVHPRREFRAAA